MICYDESMNAVQKEQMDLVIRYWDVCTRYLDSQFLYRPNSKELYKKILHGTEQFGKNAVLQLSMDGPTVNWNVLHKMVSDRAEGCLADLINIGSCGPAHCAFQTGTKLTG